MKKGVVKDVILTLIIMALCTSHLFVFYKLKIANSNIEKYKGEISNYEKDTDNKEDNDEQDNIYELSKQLDESKDRIRVLLAEKGDLNYLLESRDMVIKENETKLSEYANNIEKLNKFSEASTNQYNQKIKENTTTINTLKLQITSLTSDNEAKSKEIQQLKAEIDSLKKSLESNPQQQ